MLTGRSAVRAALLFIASVGCLAAMTTATHAADPVNPAVVARPAPNAELDAQPDAVTLAFMTNPTGPAVMVVEDSSGDNVAIGKPRMVSTNITIQTNGALTPGTYTVKYRIEGPQGPEGGTYQFAIGQGDFAVTGFETWTGHRAIPSELAVPEDEQQQTTPNDEETPSDDEGDEEGDRDGDAVTGSDPAGSQTSSAPETKEASNLRLWTVGPLLGLTAGAAGLILWRRKRSEEPTPEK